MKCQEELLNSKNKCFNSVSYKLLTNATGILKFECNKGHKNYVVLQELYFERLLHMAIENLADKYYREAIFNFAASLERCFEFVIELLCLENDISEKYHKIWKLMQNQSERQLGAFYLIYTYRFKKIFRYDENMTKIRNSIIHKGIIPTKDQTLEYGKYILDSIYDVIQDVTENIDTNLLNNFTDKKLTENSKNIDRCDKNCLISTMSASILSWHIATEKQLEQEKRLIDFSHNFPEKYAEMAMKANNEGKTLGTNDLGELILVDISNSFSQKDTTLKYRGRKNIEELIQFVTRTNSFYNNVENGLVQCAVVINTMLD
jgi:hypothetical protein